MPVTIETENLADVSRLRKIPVGGVLSTSGKIVGTNYVLDNNNYTISPAGAPLSSVEIAGTNSNQHTVDLSIIPSVDYSGITEGVSHALASYFIVFDHSDKRLRLIKYENDSTFGVGYWFFVGE